MKFRVELILLFYFITTPCSLLCQQSIQWTKCFGGIDDDASNSIIKTSDNGFLIVGNTTSFDGDVIGIHGQIDTITGQTFTLGDSWVIKTDSALNIEWQKCLGGSGMEIGKKAIETTAGYIIASLGNSTDGDQSNNNGSYDYWVVKLNYTGNIIWERSFGGQSIDEVYDLAAMQDGGFVMVGTERSGNSGDINGHHGSSNNDLWLLKIDSTGTFQWQKCLGGTGPEFYGSVCTDVIGNIYIEGSTSSTDGDVTCTVFHGFNCWVTKLDSIGNIIWSSCFGGSGINDLYSLSILNDKLLLAGTSSSSDGDLTNNFGLRDAWIIVIDTAGNKIFSKSYGGSQTDEFYDAEFIDTNRIIACGWSNSADHDISSNQFTNDFNCWVLVTDLTGTIIEERMYGGSQREVFKSICRTGTHQFVFAGSSNTLNDGDVTGLHTGHGLKDVWIISVDISTTNIPYLMHDPELFVYPNPFKDNINIKFNDVLLEAPIIKLFDIRGKNINVELDCHLNELKIKPQQNLSAGVYILSINTNSIIYTLKIIKS